VEEVVVAQITVVLQDKEVEPEVEVELC